MRSSSRSSTVAMAQSGLPTTSFAIASAVSRVNSTSLPAWKRRTNRSSTASLTRSPTLSTTSRSRAASPATPSVASTCWQKPCVVAIVAASKLETARSRRSTRAATSAGEPRRRWSITTSCSSPSPGARASALAAALRRCHTRSRNVPVALRVNVTTSSSSSGRPSATSLTTSEATAWVLPVPALASRTVIPSSTAAVGSNSGYAVIGSPAAPRRRSAARAGGRGRRSADRRRPRRCGAVRRAPRGAPRRCPPGTS